MCGTARALRAAWWRRMRIRVTGRARSRMKQKGLGAMADTKTFLLQFNFVCRKKRNKSWEIEGEVDVMWLLRVRVAMTHSCTYYNDDIVL